MKARVFALSLERGDRMTLRWSHDILLRLTTIYHPTSPLFFFNCILPNIPAYILPLIKSISILQRCLIFLSFTSLCLQKRKMLVCLCGHR